MSDLPLKPGQWIWAGPSLLVVRTRHVLDDHGRLHRSLRVFCPRKETAIAPERCTGCDALVGGDPASGEDLFCTGLAAPTSRFRGAPVPPEGRAHDIRAAPETTPAGAAMGDVFCVWAETPLQVFGRSEVDRPFVVTDRQGVPLGTLSLHEARARASNLALSVGDVLRRTIPVLRETDRLSKALGLLRREGLHHACIVGRDQTVVGLLSDIGAMQWLSDQAP